MPTLGGLVDCVYIDPPYNTGNENWCYNDNLKNPRLQQWLGKVVAMDDMEKSDKWCCMIYPRLLLLYELLAEDGTIFVSIDDNEQHRLRMIMDEIFGHENFVANIVVQSNPSGRNYGGVARTHEYVLAYAKQKNKQPRQGEADPEKLPYEDEYGRYTVSDMTNGSNRFHAGNRPNLYFPIYANPKVKDQNGFHETSLDKQRGWVEVRPRETRDVQLVWRWGKQKIATNPNEVKAKLSKDGKFRIIKKTRDKAKRLRSILMGSEYLNSAGTKRLKDIFDGEGVFDYPKSPQLIQELVDLVTEPDGVVLDSFAGSGTTAQAVLALNRQDDGDRKFVLVESEDYADDVTANRVRKIIEGIPNANDEALHAGHPGTTFSYWELGEPVDVDTLLFAEQLPQREELARILFHIATSEKYVELENPKSEHHIGTTAEYEIYLYYQPSKEYLVNTAITLDEVRALPAVATGKCGVIYAPSCHVTSEVLASHNYKYLNLPNAVFQHLSLAP